jgi:hypothetical protein
MLVQIIAVKALEMPRHVGLRVRVEVAEMAKPVAPVLFCLVVNPRTLLLEHCHAALLVRTHIGAQIRIDMSPV